jgi:peptidoglycan/xylan/chitin deacetylase (PgdA/CDA1 family)
VAGNPLDASSDGFHGTVGLMENGNDRKETSTLGFLIAIVARPPLPVLRILRRLPVNGMNKALFFVDTDRARLALTLDDGPHPDTTRPVLDVLSRHDSKATFFLIGSRAEKYPDLVEEIADAGHELGNHTWKDESSARLRPECFRDSLEKTHHELTERAPDRDVRLFRPGGGRPSAGTVFYAEAALRYRCVLASVYPHDVRVPSAEWIVRDVVRRAHPGAIIAMHEGSGRGRVASMLDEVLTELKPPYDVTTVSNLVSPH